MALPLPLSLGRLVEHDPASRAYRVTVPAVVHTVRWKHAGPVLYQGDLGACTGFALAQCLNTRPLRMRRPLLGDQDGRDIYSLGTSLDEFPGQWPTEDTGSSGLGVCKAAKLKGLIREYRHCFGIEDLKGALMTQPVIVGTKWTTYMFRPDSDGFVIPKGAEAGGHEYVILGYAAKDRYFTGLNSWSDQWGMKGYFRIHEDDMAELLYDNGDATVPVR